ncbi:MULTISPECIES: hypothetical protein [unclassified Shewanella]|uniref:hypothetical protein n=1 Tax=unclassified Shewanella TaxID=196818 RepID=UPI003552A48E
MDIKKIKFLAKELQNALPFGSEGIVTPEEYAHALAIADELTDDYKDSYAILLDVLCPPIKRYEDTAPEFTEFNRRIAKSETEDEKRLVELVKSRLNQPKIDVDIDDL